MIRRLALVAALTGTALAAVGCASMGEEGAAAPQPTRTVDKDRLYIGVWHEIARNPMKITDGCVAGETRFTTNDSGVLVDRDSCKVGDPNTGKEKVFEGPVSFPDAAASAKFHTTYMVFGIFPVGRDYWVLDHDEGYTWFIVTTPSFKDLSIFTRDPQAGPAVRDNLVARAKGLGYDVSKLEYPAQPAR